MSAVLVLSADDVDAVLANTSPDDLVRLMGRVFAALQTPASPPTDPSAAPPSLQQPHRITLDLPHHTTLFMPSRLDSAGGSAIKVVSVPKGQSLAGLPATTLVMNEKTGAVRAVVNARKLTAVRTAAGSALAVTVIGPSAPKALVLFGAGLQVFHHASLFLSLFSSIKLCTIVNRTRNTRLNSLIESLSRLHPTVAFNSLPSAGVLDQGPIKNCVSSADIICSATSSTVPLYDASWVKSGTCIVLIGSYKPSMREVSSALIDRAGIVVVDSREACLAEAGEFIEAQLEAQDLVELGEMLDEHGNPLPNIRERTKAAGDALGDVSIFKSVGIGVQDVAIAGLVVDQADKLMIGTRVNYE